MSDVIAFSPESIAEPRERPYTSLAQRYHDLVVIGTVSLLFSGFAGWLFSAGLLPIPPLAWVFALIGVSLPLLFSLKTWRALTRSPVTPWGAAYLMINTVSFLWSPQTGAVVQELRTRVLVVVLLLLLVGILNSERAVLVARRTLIGCAFVAVGTNIYEVFHPLTFSGIIGRSAGFYGNPNSSGSAMVLVIILTLEIVSPRYRALYLIVGCVGTVLTLSRGAILASGLAFGFLWTRRVIKLKRIVIGLGMAGVLMVVVFVSSGQVRRLAELAQMAVRSGVLQRITDPEVAMEGADNSTNLRADAAKRAWEQFKVNPVLGKGIGSTLGAYGLPSTHNIYLRQLAEFGFLGVFVYPLLLFAIARRATPRVRATTYAFLLSMLLFGLFSHNILDEWYYLVAIAVMSAMTDQNHEDESEAATEE